MCSLSSTRQQLDMRSEREEWNELEHNNRTGNGMEGENGIWLELAGGYSGLEPLKIRSKYKT